VEHPSPDCDSLFQGKNDDANDDVETVESLPKVIQENIELKKYYIRRHTIFSRYDEGIQLDKGMYYIYLLHISTYIFTTYIS